MAVNGTINLYDLGFRFYHDPNLYYEVTPDAKIRIDPANGQAVVYFGMRDYLVEGVRTRKKLKVVQGAPAFFLEPIDQSGQRNWDGVINISWDRNGHFTHWSGTLSAPERISDYYSPETAATNDNTEARVAFLFAYNQDAKYKIKNAATGNTRTVAAHNTTKVTLNKNEYIDGIECYSNRDRLLDELISGRENAKKITITFDLAYDFTGESRGLNFFTMPDTAVQVLEYEI